LTRSCWCATASVWRSRPELAGQHGWIKRIAAAAALGGAAGLALLLPTSAEGFEAVVPILLGLASLAIRLPRRIDQQARIASHQRHTATVYFESAAIFVISICGGYFGAAAVVLLLTLLLGAGHATLAHAHAAKNVLRGVANGVAALTFIVLAPVQWQAVVPLGLGCLLRSRLDPVVVRHAQSGPMKALIGVAGLAPAVKPQCGHLRLGQAEWTVALGHSGTQVDQVLRVRVQSLARVAAGLPDQKP
jgi:uncharacterized protein